MTLPGLGITEVIAAILELMLLRTDAAEETLLEKQKC